MRIGIVLKCLLISLLAFSSIRVSSQNVEDTDNLFYVVIGAFANPRNADEYTAAAKKKNFNAISALNPVRRLYYVYILEAPVKSDAVKLAVSLQQQAEYSDTWVYTGLLGNNPRVVKIDKKELIEETLTSDDNSVKMTESVTEKEPAVKPEDGSKNFIFKIRSIETGETIIGDVDIFDADIIKGRKLVSYRGNDIVNVKPLNKSGNLAVVCDVFGYRKLQLPINFNDPKFEDAVSQENNNIVMTFDLVPLKKGDKVIMYNVYFFNDAAIMRPESRYEVNALLDMLKDRPTSRIKIHGHTNGNNFGTIIMQGESDNFFALDTSNKKTKGSAAKLSEERARAIQSYLVNEGIDISRMEIKAWGGKSPIYEKDHALAQANVRVEIEILAE